MTQLVLVAVGVLFGASAIAQSPGVLLNELMWDGDEYIELYNPLDEEVSLEGYRITRQKADGGEQEIITFGEDSSIESKGYFLVEKKEDATSVSADVVAGSLTLVNTGELVRLYDKSGSVIDSAGEFGAWPAGKNTESGVSMERGNGTWYTSSGNVGGRSGTPKQENSSGVVDTEEQEQESQAPSTSYSTSIVINEFLPNPKGSDTEHEFIELYNPTDEKADLSGWKIDDASGGSSPYTIPNGIVIGGRQYKVFYSSETRIALNNTSDAVRLLDPSGDVQAEARYETVAEDQSYNRVGSEYKVSTSLTPGRANEITAPEKSVSATSSPKPTTKAATPSPALVRTGAYSKDVKIWRILPDPEGKDEEGEFIELKNTGSKTISLEGWQLDDEEGGSAPYDIPADVSVPAGGVHVFMRTETGIALNNTTDTVRLFAPDGELIDSYSYEDTSEGDVLVSSGSVAGAATVAPSVEEREERSNTTKVLAEQKPKSSNEEQAEGGPSAPVSLALEGMGEEDVNEKDSSVTKPGRSRTVAGGLLVLAAGAAAFGYGNPKYVQSLLKKK